MPRRLAFGFVAFPALAAATALALASSGVSVRDSFGPIAGSTGAAPLGGKPAEFDCTLCHDTNPPNAASGKVEILNLPRTYNPGQVYAITVRLSNSATAAMSGRKWGFELTAARASDGQGSGTFLVTDPTATQVVAGSGAFASRRYAEQTGTGTRTGLPSPVQWTVQWQAPATAEGTVHFFCAGNSADGKAGTDNDWIFTTRESAQAPDLTGVPAADPAGVSFDAPTPNPARGPITLAWSLPQAGRVELSILDVRGGLVRRLVLGERAAGPGRAQWDGRRDDGARAAKGTYFARLRVSASGPGARGPGARGVMLVRPLTLAR